VACWRGYLSGARCRLAYGPADATATHCLLLQLNPDWFTFLVPDHPGSPGQMAAKLVCVCFMLHLHGTKVVDSTSSEGFSSDMLSLQLLM